MAYFTIGIGKNLIASETLSGNMRDLVPATQRTGNSFHGFKTVSSVCIRYGLAKAIPEIMLGPDTCGRWLLISGVPLITLRTDNERFLMLNEFISNPFDTLNARFDGSFAAVAYDAPTNTVIAATDYYNTVPLFFTEHQGAIYLSSHELALAKSIHASIDPLGFSQMINTGFTWGHQTRFREILKSQPCQLAVWKGCADPSLQYYWKPSHETVWAGTLDHILDEWIPRLKLSVESYYEHSGRRPFLVDFTGGEDSRIVLSACHAADIPFQGHVTGYATDPDVVVARKGAAAGGFELVVRTTTLPKEEDILGDAIDAVLESDGYDVFFRASVIRSTDRANPIDRFGRVQPGGFPGGEVFRGIYYPRAKVLFPEMKGRIDYRFFFNLKFLMDFSMNMVKFPDRECIAAIFSTVTGQIDDVSGFSLGTQVDHLERLYQAVPEGLRFKIPAWVPLAGKDMTRSVYNLPAHVKTGGRLFKAATELLFPEISHVKVVTGVPTIRKTLLRTHLFIPEYTAIVKKAATGILARRIKILCEPRVSYFRRNFNQSIFMTLLNSPPYRKWFERPESMLTGSLLDGDRLGLLLREGKDGSSRRIPLLGRVISGELALRWVFDELR